MNKLTKIVIVLDVSNLTNELSRYGYDKLSILHPIYKYVRETFPQVQLATDTENEYGYYMFNKLYNRNVDIENILDHKLKIIWNTLSNNKIFALDSNPLLRIFIPETINNHFDYVILIFYVENKKG